MGQPSDGGGIGKNRNTPVIVAVVAVVALLLVGAVALKASDGGPDAVTTREFSRQLCNASKEFKKSETWKRFAPDTASAKDNDLATKLGQDALAGESERSDAKELVLAVVDMRIKMMETDRGVVEEFVIDKPAGEDLRTEMLGQYKEMEADYSSSRDAVKDIDPSSPDAGTALLSELNGINSVGNSLTVSNNAARELGIEVNQATLGMGCEWVLTRDS